MFIRIKKIKGNKYAYLVENKWKKTKDSARQKVKGYLGRTHELTYQEYDRENLEADKVNNELDKVNNECVSDGQLVDIKDLRYMGIVIHLVKDHLKKNGFEEKDKKMINCNKIFDLKTYKFTENNKSIVFESGEGYLCDYTLKKLLKFIPDGYDELVGKNLAKIFVDAGIPISQKDFITTFEKIYKS